jgi:predicted transposase YbfD/YdcC
VADKTHEIPVLDDVLRALVIEGRVLTVDALLTQRAIAERIVHGGGDYVRLVKGNQPQLQHDMQLVFQEAHTLAETMATAETVDSGHGRLEQRRLTVSSALMGYSDWPGLVQVFPRERRVSMKKHAEQRHEVISGVTSLCLDQADPERLLAWSGSIGRSRTKSTGSAM